MDGWMDVAVASLAVGRVHGHHFHARRLEMDTGSLRMAQQKHFPPLSLLPTPADEPSTTSIEICLQGKAMQLNLHAWAIACELYAKQCDAFTCFYHGGWSGFKHRHDCRPDVGATSSHPRGRSGHQSHHRPWP